MASIYDFKARFQALLRPLVRALARARVSANQVTIVAVLLSGATGAWIAWSEGSRAALFAVPIVLFVRMALNAVDGMLAREHGQKSRLGAVLNELGDVIADAMLYLPFALLVGVPVSLVVVVVMLAVISEMTGVVAIQVGASRRYDGPMGKSDRAFVFGVLALALALGAPRSDWIALLMGAVAVLLLVTIWNRARRALAEGAAA
ncbi:MAG: CDP-alcohol phosphatidyltransferase family protein [Proteobacteria bacterium]|nr:CDP-alcohol phosphatidyltransferase family protein [Pseudomonadota bacterium]